MILRQSPALRRGGLGAGLEPTRLEAQKKRAGLAPCPPSAVRQRDVGPGLLDQGHLHVLPDLVARAVVTRGGRYEFRNVPAGTYQLRIFHGAREAATPREVEVTDSTVTVPAVTLSASADASP